MTTALKAEIVTSIQRYTNMSKAVRWQVPFANLSGQQYRIDIYDEQDGSWSGITQLLAGEDPFTTEEDNSEDFFYPVRTQTGTLQICTRLEDGTMFSLEDIIPASNIDHPIMVWSLGPQGDEQDIEWQGFLSCESYNQSYTSIPEVLSLPVISVLEAMKSIELPYSNIARIGATTIGDFIQFIFDKVEDATSMQVGFIVSLCSNDILTKYILESKYFSYQKDDATGGTSYIIKSTSLHDILSEICLFMGWCLREQGTNVYFMRNWTDELGMTTIDMSSLEWRGTDHQRTIMQGAKRVSIKSDLSDFNTSFEMTTCPYSGLNTKNFYSSGSYPYWYYDKCTQANVGVFSSEDVSKCFLARFYGINQDSSYRWNTLYANLGFSNSIYMVGHAFTDTSYSKLCTIKSVMRFTIVCGVTGTAEDVGYLILKISEEVARKREVNGYMRFGLKFLGKYYKEVSIGNPIWTNDSSGTFKVDMTNGSGELRIQIPRLSSAYTIASSEIELYIYNDFEIGNSNSAIISDVSLKYEPPYTPDKEMASENAYIRNLNKSRDEISTDLNLASSIGNINSLSHIYGIHTYDIGGGDTFDYIEPITSLSYALAGGTTTNRRPEVDLLNRMASYYGAARQRIELKVKHPTAAALPMLKLNGINDGKTYLPLSESRDWRTEECTLTCFEAP